MKWQAMSVLHKVAAIDAELVEVPGDSNDKCERGPSRKWGVVLPLFSAPAPILETVGHHIILTFIAWVNVDSNVRTGPGTTL